MYYKEISSNPDVMQVIKNAENEIYSITGLNVMLGIDAFEFNPPAIHLLKQAVCLHSGLMWERIIQRNGSDREARDFLHIFMYLATKMLGCSMHKTAKYCNRYNHTTVIAAIKKIQGFYDVSDPLCDHVEAVKKILKTKLNENEKV